MDVSARAAGGARSGGPALPSAVDDEPSDEADDQGLNGSAASLPGSSREGDRADAGSLVEGDLEQSHRSDSDAAAAGEVDGGSHDGDGVDDGEMDRETAAWNEFAEDDVSHASGTVTPLGSGSSSEELAGEHPLDEAFYDEVFTRDDTQVGACPFRTKEDFFSFILISSTVGLTERQYNISRAFCNTDRSRKDTLPGYTTTTRRVIPAAIKAAGLPMETLNIEGAKCWYVLPSTHVARDLAFEDTYDLFFAAEDRSESMREQEPEFYDTMFFQNKAAILQSVLQHASFTLNGTRFRSGSWLSISLDGSEGLMRVLVDRVSIAPAESGVGLDHGRHAGDLVVVCHNEDGLAAGALLSRHWLPADLDALVWIPADNGSSCAVVDVSLAEGHEPLGPNGADGSGAYQHSSSGARRIRGVGADGVPTLVVCIALYADDFVCRERGHQSAGGVYMYYPGWRSSARMSSSAVRTISVTPAGVNSDKVLEAITSNLVEGTTTGWALKDCHSSAVRVFADVSFFVGDYVQVSKSSRMRGHNACAPCPLCAYSLPGGEGSQYAGPGSAADTGLMRTTARTVAVLRAARDADA